LSGGHLNYVLPFPVYYINMEQSSARRERMQLDFGDIWDLRRSPAVDGMDAGAVVELMGQANYDEILPSLSKDRYPGTINGGELGCVLSHLTAIRRAYIDGNDMAMIVEDDITPLLMQVHIQLVFCGFVFRPCLLIDFFCIITGHSGQAHSWTW